MGIHLPSAKFLQSESRRGVVLGRMLTLGHQTIYMDRDERADFLSPLGVSPEVQYADDLFRALGATAVDVMDASNYEGANVICDLSQPVDPRYFGIYDCVFDGGSLEHVFNFPVALKNCLEMVKVGGHFITITPTNNWSGHGFYQFSPELFYTALSGANGFSVERLLFDHRDRWYSVRRPDDVKSRVELCLPEPTQLYVSAKRLEQKPIFRGWPQQSDYVQRWTTPKPAANAARSGQSLKETLVRTVPFLKELRTAWRVSKRRKQCSPANSEWFTPVELDK